MAKTPLLVDFKRRRNYMQKEFTALLQKLQSVQEAVSLLEKGRQGINLTGLSGTAKSSFLAAVLQLRSQGGVAVLLVARREDIRDYRRELAYFFPELAMQELYPANLVTVRAEAKNQEILAERVLALRTLHGENSGLVFITAEALMQKLPVPTGLFTQKLVVSVGEELEQGQLIAQLVERGYERTEQVEALGQFCLRGDIMDVYPINEQDPVRIEWFDNQIDAVRNFSLGNQRALGSKQAVEVVSLKIEEAAGTASILDYLQPNTTVIIDEPTKLLTTVENLAGENSEYEEQLFTLEEVEAICQQTRGLAVSALPHKAFATYQQLVAPIRSVAPYNRNTELLTGDLKGWLAEGLAPLIMMSTKEKAAGLAASLQGKGLPAVYVKTGTALPLPDKIGVFSGELASGFRCWDEFWLLLTE
ncbi:MAG: transcription-repair coupling factor, partial [Acidaminococcaceae bacterium]